jgi:hypothetical protein
MARVADSSEMISSALLLVAHARDLFTSRNILADGGMVPRSSTTTERSRHDY